MRIRTEKKIYIQGHYTYIIQQHTLAYNMQHTSYNIIKSFIHILYSQSAY